MILVLGLYELLAEQNLTEIKLGDGSAVSVKKNLGALFPKTSEERASLSMAS